MVISRDFKGIFIPREIYLNRELTPLEKMLWAEIHSLLDRKRGGCYASNEYLAEHLGVSERFIREMISNLKKHGLVEEVSFDGRVRIIRAKVPPEDFGEERNCSSGLPGTDERGTAVPVSEEPQFQKGVPPHNIENKDKKKDSYVPSASASGLASDLLSAIRSFKADFKEPKLTEWTKDIDKMIRLDSRSPEQIKKIIAWLPSNDFWRKNILSADKLRKQFDKLELVISEEKKNDWYKENLNTLNKWKVENPKFFKKLIVKGNYLVNTENSKEFHIGNTPPQKLIEVFVSVAEADYEV